ncbi:esterase family protein [Ornithinicoccus hortensis]|uniref:Esterase/lipase superfamily enzyme n=1 Tax=Ornithinicoccus hortensis TaxID=82346 RepID=A0A542YLU1_9MICO|nr:alpha/beta hydrolase-fold protein [Ornithinicoccus hortensis]TQL49043.1 esterase/lipase superfamily enzyme [Ornithinicoccus hortensis]
MEREQAEIYGEGLDRPGTVIRYGHYGRPVMAFPSEAGRAWDYENNGMVDAVSDLVEAGRIKIYAVDSFDASSWSNYGLPTEERARRHTAYENWIVNHVVPTIGADSPGHQGIVTTGCSMGAYHAVNFALKRPDLFPVGIGLSGNYDPTSWRSWGEIGQATYFNNPTAYLANAHGDHLAYLRQAVQVLLVVGQGPFEVHPTRSLPGAHQLAEVLRAKGVPHQLDVWGHDSAHDWPWWRKQIAHHLPRFC